MTFAWQIDEAANRVNSVTEDYLRRWGWSMTCNTPGAYWLWVRDFRAEDRKRIARWRRRKPGPTGKPPRPVGYGRVMATTEIAVRMTISDLDPQKELEQVRE